MLAKTLRCSLPILVLLFTATAQAETTKLTWHGHATFEVQTPKGTILMIDPWLNNPLHPKVKAKQDPLANITKVDYILLTHGHFDHIADAVAIAKKTKARLVASFELGKNMAKVLGYPEKQMGLDGLMNIGGDVKIADGDVLVHMTPAVHSSGLDDPRSKTSPVRYSGSPVGFVLSIQNGPTIYHTGDTAYFGDMKLIGNHHKIDVALINIGGHFGMEPMMAVETAQAVRAKLVSSV